MNDKEFSILAIVVAIAGFFWYWWEKKHNIAATPAGLPSAFPADPYGPMADYSPPEMTTMPDLQINIANQTPNLLTNQMIPLFGFVGMAQGTFWQ